MRAVKTRISPRTLDVFVQKLYDSTLLVLVDEILDEKVSRKFHHRHPFCRSTHLRERVLRLVLRSLFVRASLSSPRLAALDPTASQLIPGDEPRRRLPRVTPPTAKIFLHRPRLGARRHFPAPLSRAAAVRARRRRARRHVRVGVFDRDRPSTHRTRREHRSRRVHDVLFPPSRARPSRARARRPHPRSLASAPLSRARPFPRPIPSRARRHERGERVHRRAASITRVRVAVIVAHARASTVARRRVPSPIRLVVYHTGGLVRT